MFTHCCDQVCSLFIVFFLFTDRVGLCCFYVIFYNFIALNLNCKFLCSSLSVKLTIRTIRYVYSGQNELFGILLFALNDDCSIRHIL